MPLLRLHQVRPEARLLDLHKRENNNATHHS
jgi:hypothetical protein